MDYAEIYVVQSAKKTDTISCVQKVGLWVIGLQEIQTEFESFLKYIKKKYLKHRKSNEGVVKHEFLII